MVWRTLSYVPVQYVLRPYPKVDLGVGQFDLIPIMVWRCRLTLSNPTSNRLELSA